MADPKHPRKFSEEFKRQIVQLHGNGESPGEVKAEYDVGNSTLHRWIRAIRGSGSTRAAYNRAPEQRRVLDPEREDRRLRVEADVLKAAALTFARR